MEKVHFSKGDAGVKKLFKNVFFVTEGHINIKFSM